MSERSEASVPKRFMAKVRPCTSGCWLWTGMEKFGYGMLKVGGKLRRAHRISYELHVGRIPDGIDVLHACDVPGCVNPAHLFLGGDKQNMADAARKGRMAQKLAPDAVKAIRADSRTQQEIADEYCIHQSMVSGIKKRRYWTHIA